MSAPNDPQKKPVDLSDLQSLNFGPSWATSSTPRPPSAPRESRDYGDRRDNRGGGKGFGDRRPPDRRGFGGGQQQRQGGRDSFNQDRQQTGGRRPEGGRRFNDGPRRDQNFERREPRDSRPQHRPGNYQDSGNRYGPVAEVAFFPEDKPFQVLTKAVAASLRTYELFEIAHLILEKNDRFLVGCRPFNHGTNKDARIYQSVPDQIPFLSEAEAIAHVMHKHLERFFTVETVEIDPPKGNFLMVSKCGITGEVLGPPNYHGYQQALREHHAARLSRMPFDRFTSRIESVRDQALVDQWMARMKQVTRYTLKDHKEGDPVSFDSLDAARNFLIAHRKTQLVRALDFVRFPGRMIGSMPNGPLRDSIEGELGYQRQFPLLTANGLRSRLKKEGLNLFKRGPKAITFVSSVYPRSRTAETVFADNIQKVVDFIERNPEIKITELPEKLLGIAPVAASPQVPPSEASSTNDTPVEAKPETVEAPAPVSAETPEAPKSDTPETGEAPVEEPVETTPVADAAVASEEALKAEEPVVAKPEPVAEKIEAAPKPTAKPAPAPEPAAAVDLSNPAVRELLNTVRWLVSEGYVTEYSDGCLFAMPVMTEAQIKEAAERAARRQPKRGNPASTDEHQEAEADMMQQEDVSDSDSGPV